MEGAFLTPVEFSQGRIFSLGFCTYDWLAMPRLCYSISTFGSVCSRRSLHEACGALIHTIQSFSRCMKRAR